MSVHNYVMKDSRISWIGDIPESWGLTKVSNQYDVTLGKMLCTSPETPDSTEENYLCSANVKRNGIEGDIKTMWFTPKEKEEYLLKKGDLIVSEGGNAGTPMIYNGSRDPCYIQNAVHRVRAYDNQDIRNRFLYYWMSFAKDIGYVDLVCNKATIAHFTKKKLMEMPVVSIDLDTMSDIVHHLDKKCTQIDNIIRQNSLIVDKLSNLKQSIISEVVTKGLDSNVTLKDSGVDWIGSVPCDWNIVSIKSRFVIQKRIAGKLGYDVLSVTQEGIKVKDITSNDGQLSNDYSKYQLVYKGDFVMNHMDLLTGFVDCSKFDGVTSPDYRVFSLNTDDLLPRYALYILQMGYKNRIFYGMGQGVSSLGRWRLPKDQFMNFLIPLPPLNVQKSIISYLDQQCGIIDSVISNYSELILKLSEFKQSLIYEYVTGKRSVSVEAS